MFTHYFRQFKLMIVEYSTVNMPRKSLKRSFLSLYLLCYLGLFFTTGVNAWAQDQLMFGTSTGQGLQQNYRFEGTIRSADGQGLEGINLFFPTLNKGTVTNSRGRFSIRLPEGNHLLRIEGLGFETQQIQLGLYQDAQTSFTLAEQAEELDEVVVRNQQNENVESEMLGKSSLSLMETKNIPLVLGEQNILKAATILPGISSAGEAATGFNVRGGKADQNLMLLNEAIVVNPNHFFGIFQALNPFAINRLNVYKGNIPIQYEGRTSSVFELSTKSPNQEKFQAEVSLGPITANALVETPVVKNRSGLLLGARSAHSDWVLRSLKDPKLKNSSARFHDLLMVYEDRLTEKDKILATAYHSEDQFSITSDSLYRYTNTVAAVNWKHQFNPKNSASVVLSHSDYAFSIRYDGGVSNNFESAFALQIDAARLKLNSKIRSNHSLTYGANLVRYSINPGAIRPLGSNDLIREEKLPQEVGVEGSLYIADRIEIGENFVLNLGAQLALYSALGPAIQRNYLPGVPKSDLSVTDIQTYQDNEGFAQKAFPNYRLSGRYKFSPNTSIKFAAISIYQFIHSLSNNTTASPIDTWRISSNHLKPQGSQQFSIGVFNNQPERGLELSLEGFYKRQENLVDFKTGAQLFLNEYIETDVLQGEGEAYGVEFLLRKKKGRHSGWLGYTYARSFIQLDSPFSSERVNNGKFFPTNYDKPHDLSVAWNYRLGKRLSFSTNVLYQTGRPITLPAGNFQFDGAEYVLFSDRNAYRIPDYYRVDLSLNYDYKEKSTKNVGFSWSVSVYNVLGRNNPFSVFFVGEDGVIRGRQSSIFNVPIPSLNLQLKI